MEGVHKLHNLCNFDPLNMKYIFFTLLLVCSVSILTAQVNLNDSCVSANIITIDLGVGLPAADLADRFGPHAIVGGGYQYKTNKNWLYSISGAFIYGSAVKEDTIVNNLKNEEGYIVGTDGLQYDPILWESGFTASVQVGKITNLLSINPNSGVTFMGGIGFLQHNIWIYIDETAIPQLSEEYKKGYDRLSNGIAFNQYIGYYLFSNKYFVNFRAGIEITEGITQNRRSINYDTQVKDDATRIDMMVNFKLSWNLPIFEQPTRKFYSN